MYTHLLVAVQMFSFDEIDRRHYLTRWSNFENVKRDYLGTRLCLSSLKKDPQ